METTQPNNQPSSEETTAAVAEATRQQAFKSLARKAALKNFSATAVNMLLQFGAAFAGGYVALKVHDKLSNKTESNNAAV